MSKAKIVYMYDLEGYYIRDYSSAKKASEALSISRQGVNYACLGKSLSAGGFMFRYDKHEKIEPHPSAMPMKEVCSVKDCDKKPISGSSDYCSKHYTQIIKHGRIMTRTKFDPNEYEILEDERSVKIYLYSENSYEKADGFFLIDLDDFEEIRKYTWGRVKNDRGGYVCRKESKNGKMNTIYLHRQIMGLDIEEYVVDHINGDGMDNRRKNLRIVSQLGNTRNRSNSPKNYYYNKANDSWIANITIGNKTVYLGSYKTEEEANEVARRERERHYLIEEYKLEDVI